MLHSVSGIQRRPQRPLRNKEGLVRERILDFPAGREPTHIDQSLIGSVWAFHKTRFAGNGRAVGIIALGRFCWSGGRRWRSRWLRICFGVFRRRRVWIEWLLGWLIFRTRFGWVSRGLIPCAAPHRFFIAASRNKECGQQRK